MSSQPANGSDKGVLNLKTSGDMSNTISLKDSRVVGKVYSDETRLRKILLTIDMYRKNNNLFL